MHLLEETRVSHEEELKALEAELEVAKNEMNVLNARCSSPSFVQELEELQVCNKRGRITAWLVPCLSPCLLLYASRSATQVRLATADQQKTKVEQKLAYAKVRIKELEQEAANTAKYKMELRKDMSLLEAKLAEQSQTVATMKAAIDQSSTKDQVRATRQIRCLS